MHLIKNRLCFTGKSQASVYFDSHSRCGVAFKAEKFVEYRFFDVYGRLVADGRALEAQFELDGTGNFRLTFLPHEEGITEITLFCDDGVIPFLMPGVGVLWDHGAVFSLLLARRQPHTVWVPTADVDVSAAVAVVKGVDYGEDVAVTADGEIFVADWYPKMKRPWFWHSAELPSARLIRFDLPEEKSGIRFTVYNRSVFLLEEPQRSFEFGRLSVSVADGCDAAMDSRVEVFSGNERVAMYDKLSNEDAHVYLPRGVYRVKASHGMFWSEAEKEVCIGDGDTHIDMKLEQTVELPKGWMFGELHTHSALEDATLFPRQVMRAARACGRNFCFMTDKSVERLDRFGLHDCDREGVFSAFPGQEIMCHELHTNVLNPSHTIDNPEAEELDAVNHDIEKMIGSWLAQYRKMKELRPCLIMHNHPEHRAEVMKRGQPYFRSWWVSDMFREDYHLVENCGFEGWFDRLNRGRKIYAAWTGDGHDCTLMYPGMEGVCVYTGGDLSAKAVIDALEGGRFFSCRAPGVFVNIALTGERTVTVSARAPIEIDRIEVVADGCAISVIEGEDNCQMEFVCDIPSDVRWVMARVRLSGGEWDEKNHSFTPFMESGYAAFTNPIFIK